MIITKLMGGLGNQMFQYAFGKYLAVKNNTELKLDTTFLLNRSFVKKDFVYRDYDLSVFNIEEKFATASEVKFFSRWTDYKVINNMVCNVIGPKKSYIKYLDQTFLPELLDLPDNTYIEGYWQSEKYFKPVSDLLRTRDFTFKESMQDISTDLLKKINNSNSVCINVRRGDFVTSSFHGLMDVEYYNKAADILTSNYSNLEFYVFSDEIEWCEQNLNFAVPTTYVSHIFAGRKFQDYLRLMSGCKYFIIPNSSFAWWAAWLSSYADKCVIAPKHWFNPKHPAFHNFNFDNMDILPENWIKL